MQQEKEIKGIQIRRKRWNSLFVDDMIYSLKRIFKSPHQSYLNKWSQQGKRIQDKYTEIFVFLYTKNEMKYQKEKAKKKVHLNCILKIGINLTREVKDLHVEN